MDITMLRVVKTKRVFPQESSSEKITTRLSVLDATVARFSPTASIWFYDRSDGVSTREEVFPALEISLSQTLNDYRHFAGQLRWATEKETKHTAVPHHLGRLSVDHGTPTDPGVELVTAECDANLADVVPERAAAANSSDCSPNIWDATAFRQHDFTPATKMALSSLDVLCAGLPSVAVRLTAFRCGGFSVCTTMAHPLADAAGLMSFMRAWAARSRDTLLKGMRELDHDAVAPPMIDPSRLETLAGLCIVPEQHAPPPDRRKIEIARALPMHRYDWWDWSAPGYPTVTRKATEATMPSSLDSVALSPSEPPPWPSWDMAAPVERVQIMFPAAALACLKATAESTMPAGNSRIISRLDALLAHLWILINRARYPHHSPAESESEEEVYMDITLGLRHRFSPPLPDKFAGSPLLLAHAKQQPAAMATATIGEIASQIRETVEKFTPEAVAAYVHDAAHEVSPQRLWQAFLGKRHVLVTSWARLGVYGLDPCGGGSQGKGAKARYVQGVMPLMDGLLQVVDVDGAGALDASLCLEKGAMERLLRDPAMHAY